MLILLSILSVIALIASLVILVYRFFKKKPKKPAVIALICSFVLCLVFSFAYNASLTPEERAAMQQQYQERKAKELADKQAAQEEKDRIAAEKAAKEAEKKADEQAQQEESQQSADNQANSSDSSTDSFDSSSDDFSTAVTDTTSELMNKEYYPYVQDVSFSVDPDDKNITMMAVLNSSTNKRTALDFADTMIRRFSSNVVAHDGSYSMPSKDFYGSLFDTYKITIGVAPSSATDNPDRWYYSKVIYPGNHTQQGPRVK